jgi:hypothetical protein
MPETGERKYCKHCKKEVAVRIDPVVHWKHFLLSIFTCLIWLPVWLSLIFYPTKLCAECGEPFWSTDEGAGGTSTGGAKK